VDVSLAGKVALVTGARPNIGSGIVRALSRYGARVACNDLELAAAKASVRRRLKAPRRRAENTVRAVVQTGPRRMEVREFPRPVIGPDDGGLLQVEACGICGSDVEQYKGSMGLIL
jgi:NAD(P)-dependent dehydrogenase (short-subunit alcohol dehydrogenase family)